MSRPRLQLPRMGRYAVRAAAALTAAAALSACTPSPPEITWFANRTSATEGPALYCKVAGQTAIDCPVHDGTAARLSLFANDPLQINIPGEIANRPWLLVITYADDSQVRTPVIDDKGKTLSYTVQPSGKQLKQVDLQVLTVTPDANGQPQFTPFQIWTLTVETAQPTENGPDPGT